MTIGYFIWISDKTTCRDQIIIGDDTFKFYERSTGYQDELVTYAKHSGTYQILGVLG